MKKKIKYFATEQELRNAAAEKISEDPSAVVFIHKNALLGMSGDDIMIADGFWEEWPKVYMVRRAFDGKWIIRDKASDGEEIFFFDLQRQ